MSVKSVDTTVAAQQANPLNGMRLFGKPHAGKSGARRGVHLTPRTKGVAPVAKPATTNR